MLIYPIWLNLIGKTHKLNVKLVTARTTPSKSQSRLLSRPGQRPGKSRGDQALRWRSPPTPFNRKSAKVPPDSFMGPLREDYSSPGPGDKTPSRQQSPESTLISSFGLETRIPSNLNTDPGCQRSMSCLSTQHPPPLQSYSFLPRATATLCLQVFIG